MLASRVSSASAPKPSMLPARRATAIAAAMASSAAVGGWAASASAPPNLAGKPVVVQPAQIGAVEMQEGERPVQQFRPQRGVRHEDIDSRAKLRMSASSPPHSRRASHQRS